MWLSDPCGSLAPLVTARCALRKSVVLMDGSRGRKAASDRKRVDPGCRLGYPLECRLREGGVDEYF